MTILSWLKSKVESCLCCCLGTLLPLFLAQTLEAVRLEEEVERRRRPAARGRRGATAELMVMKFCSLFWMEEGTELGIRSPADDFLGSWGKDGGL